MNNEVIKFYLGDQDSKALYNLRLNMMRVHFVSPIAYEIAPICIFIELLKSIIISKFEKKKKVNNKITQISRLVGLFLHLGNNLLFENIFKIFKNFYIETHRAVIKFELYLFLYKHDYFYINNLDNKYPTSKLRHFISLN